MVMFVRFPYGTWDRYGIPIISPVYHYYRLSTETIKYGIDKSLSIRKIGYSYGTHRYACVINGGHGQYNDKDDTNHCYFTDDDFGFDVGGDHLAGEFIGIPVCVDNVRSMTKARTGYKVDGFAASKITGYISKDGVQSFVSVRVDSPENGYSKSSLYMDVSSFGQNYTLSVIDPTNCTLIGITADCGSRKSGTNSWLWNASTDITITFRYGSNFTVDFNANGGNGSIESQRFVSGKSQLLTKNNGQITRKNHKFIGWNTNADGTGTTYYDNADGANILTDTGAAAGGTVTLYAMWQYTAFNITATKVNSAAGGVSVTSVGTLTLVDMGRNSVVAVETDGVLYYEGTAGSHYKLSVILGNSKPDVLWNPTGVLVDGSYVSEFQFVPEVGEHVVKDFLLTEKPLCSLALAFSPADSGSTAAIVSPPEPDNDGRYAYGREIVVEVSLAVGYEVDTVRTTSGYEYAVADGQFTIPSINSDDTATIYVKKSAYRIVVSKDSPSASAITTVLVDGSAAKDANYGDAVMLTAVVASGYSFDGWYDGETLLSTEANYSHRVTGAKNIVAKAKVSVKMSIHYTDAASYQQLCTIVLNDSAYTPGETVYVTLGSSVSYELVLCSLESGGSERWKFNAWFNAPFADRTNPLALGSSGTFTPTSSVDVIAEVTPVYIENVLTILMKEDENQTDISQDGIITTIPVPDDGGWDAWSNCYKMTFYGTKEIVLTSANVVTVGSTVLAFNKFVDGSVEYNEPSCRILSNGTKTITAWYGSTGTRNTILGYGVAGGVRGDRTMGTFAIVASSDPQATISDDGSSATVRRGYTVTITAKAKNGYKFNGWFPFENIGGTPYFRLNDLTFVVSTNRSLYAWFSQDASAVYEWEGSGNNKSIEWRSKTYKSPVPFNPSCCRIDTEGYPVIEFDVDMFSAPDTEATSRSVITNVASQEARRLPVRRMERYLQVCVKNDHEVDAIFVGTNMAELAQ